MLSDKLSLQTISVRRGELEMPVVRCPHCKTGSDFSLVAHANSPKYGAKIRAAIALCRLCGGEVYMHYDPQDGDSVIDSYPLLEESVPEGIPPDVGKAIGEALRSHSASAPNASLCMSRRVIHEVVKDLTKDWGKEIQESLLKKPLPVQLNALVDKDLIPPALKDWADQARIGGKLAAHGTGGAEWGEPGKSWGNQEDSQEVINFCLSFLEYAYVIKDRLAKRRKGPASPGETGSNGQ